MRHKWLNSLVTLMEKQCDYNVPLVVQFFATLVIEDDDVKTLKWMSGTTFCKSTFKKFGTILGYGFRGHPPLGHRMHSIEAPNKNTCMTNMYGPSGQIGKIEGLLPIYDQLVRIFRSNIALSGGNNDAMTSSLINLLCLAQECIDNEDPDRDFKVDVMDYIYHGMNNAMIGGFTIPYAPYIMLLIKKTLKNQDFSRMAMESHNFKKIYDKKVKAMPRASFMRDARSSAAHQQAVVPSFTPHIKKLNWF